MVGRLQRSGQLTEREALTRLKSLVDIPIERHALQDLVLGSWRRRKNVALVDGLYVELAARLQAALVTLDARLARATHLAEVVTL